MIIYRDMSNILLVDQDIAKLEDFNISKVGNGMYIDTFITTRSTGTVWYNYYRTLQQTLNELVGNPYCVLCIAL